MTEKPEDPWRLRGVRVVRAGELDANTAQTPGMDRRAAITQGRAGANQLWAGTVSIQPNTGSRVTPERISTPPESIGSSVTPSMRTPICSALAIIDSNASATASALDRFRRMRPCSVLCATSGLTSLATSGKPIASAASRASALLCTTASCTTGTPKAARAALPSVSERALAPASNAGQAAWGAAGGKGRGAAFFHWP